MKVKSRSNGIIIDMNKHSSEVMKLGNGSYARAIRDTSKKRSKPKGRGAKKAPVNPQENPELSDDEIQALKDEAKLQGITLDDNQIEGANPDDSDDENLDENPDGDVEQL